ncbi:GntP family permease [Ornithinicoccus hortensis]|uniref:Putative D-glycerate permease n=1 Tax=Ornithinicoccus hortensis TaxID=82346 RepID=A0A542YTG1_9MICO|nr:GntP family permease [Ornithinicoccus hortensis]TQL51337.1 putative D-glycerate permease [Ornithinicoccus hortensis]
MDTVVTESVPLTLIGFAAVIVVLFFLIAKYRWHVFIALLLPIVLFAFLPGVDRGAFVEAFTTGFGGTIEEIAVVIVLGSLIAELLKRSGGVERITDSMIRFVGRRRMPLALTLAGFVIGIAIFSDVGYVILNPLVHGAAIASGSTMGTMATGLVGAMQTTHAMVPPTPGPLAAAALVDADLGTVIVLGSAVTLVASLAGWGYAMLIGSRVTSPPSKEFLGESFVEKGQQLPPLGMSYAPIVVPLILIAGGSIANLTMEEGTTAHQLLTFISWPVFALGVGVVIAYILSIRMTGKKDSADRRDAWVEEALRGSAMIIMVTGLGGSLSEILKGTPAVDVIADGVASTGLPIIFLPFVLGIVGNIITGSTTVGVITAASITAPLLGQVDLSPEAAMLAAAAGSIIIKYVNSSYFWVCTSLSRMPLRSAMICYGGVTLVNGVVAMLGVLALWGTGVI